MMENESESSTIDPSRREAAERQIRGIQKEIKFDTRDFPIETIVGRFIKGNFFIPPYQREFIWSEDDQSQFIESVVMGLPIPMMFLAENDDGLFEIVDGAQRIQTLEAFVSGDLALTNLKTIDSLNGFKFLDLSETQRNKLTSRALRIVILDQETAEENRRDLFNRINKSGRGLVASERRRGALEGEFLTFLEILRRQITSSERCHQPVSGVMCTAPPDGRSTRRPSPEARGGLP
ncbi:MAG: DUF262 domain-containing protein [Planctomycetia bacterium]